MSFSSLKHDFLKPLIFCAKRELDQKSNQKSQGCTGILQFCLKTTAARKKLADLFRCLPRARREATRLTNRVPVPRKAGALPVFRFIRLRFRKIGIPVRPDPAFRTLKVG